MAKKKKKQNNGTSKGMSDRRFLTEKARTLPIYECYITEGWEEEGEAQVIVARERGNGNLCVGIFLCDAWCLGVKEAFGKVNMSKEDFKERILDNGPDIMGCDYVMAHNLIYGSEAFAADAGIEPCAGFALWSHVLDEDTEDVPLVDIEFGDKGKYHLIAERGSKEALLAHGLQQRLGDDFIFEIGYGMNKFGNDSYDGWGDEGHGVKDEDFGLDPSSMEDMVKRMAEGFEKSRQEDQRHPDEPYSYVHPDYPSELKVKHQYIVDEFKRPTNGFVMPVKVIDKILALPKEKVVADIRNIVFHKIGETWRGIDDGTLEWKDDNTVIHAMAFLAQLADPAGFDAVLEVARQNNSFHDFHFGDSTGMILPQALYIAGRNNLDILEAFLMQPGLSGYAKGYVSDAISFIAMEEPARRAEVIELFRRYLNFMQENMQAQKGCSGYVAGTVMSSLIDIKAVELLPEIKRLYDSGYVNLNVCGSYADIEREICDSSRTPLHRFDFTGIKDFYRRMERAFKY